MASFEGPETDTVGTTPQTLVSAPGSGEQKEIFSIIAWNRDTVSRTLLAKKVGGSVTPIEVGKVTLDSGARGQLLGGGAVVLDGTGESLTVESDATATTNEPRIHASVFKVP
jgi:hypothetical protein